MPKAKIITEGDAICGKFNAVAANGLGSLTSIGITSITKLLAATSAQLKQAAPALAKVANALSTEAQQLAALGTPDKDAAQFNQVVADVKKSAAFAQVGAKAAARGDTKAFVAAAGPNGAGGIVGHGPQFGFHVCDIPSGSAPASGALPPGVRMVSVRGIRIAYRATGSGQPLLLINGSGSTLDTWEPALLAALGAGRQVIVFDPRGMGASTDVAGDRLTVEEMADDAAGLLGALGIGHADVLGWSLGGFVAQELAIRHPALVRRLVLASSTPGGRDATYATPQVNAIDTKSTLGLATPKEFLPILFPPAALSAGQAYLARLAAQPGGCCERFSQAAGQRQVAATGLWYAPTGGDEQRLTLIRAPTLIAAGALDVDVPVANARLLHSKITASQLLIYPDAGHAFLIQHATAFAAAVRRFLG